MPSKAYQRFDARITAYDADLELADILTGVFVNGPNSENSVCEAAGARPEKYPKLHLRSNTRRSRQIVALHMKSTLHIAFIKDLYEDFSEYLATSLSRAALAGIDAARFSGEVKLDLQAKEILQAGSWEGVIRLISDKIFRALENERSTITLINKISARVGLQLEDAMLVAAMPYLDARHILIHRDGKPDDIYIRNYPDINVINGKLSIGFDFIVNARNHVRALAQHIDNRMQDAGLIRPQDMMGGRL